jgi:hypothetical protein
MRTTWVGIGLLLVANAVKVGSAPRGFRIGVGLAVAVPVGAQRIGVATGYTRGTESQERVRS